MPFNDYNSLVLTIADWVGPDAGLTAFIPDWIRLAEDAFENGREMVSGKDIPPLRALDMETRGELVPGSGVGGLSDQAAWPSDCLEIRIVQQAQQNGGNVYGGPPYGSLQKVGLEQLYDPSVTKVGKSDIVTRYAVVGREVKFNAVPDSAYRYPVYYYARIPALSTLSPSNWLLQRAPSAYLYTALACGEQYLQNDARLAMWVQSSLATIASLNQSDDSTRYSGGPMTPTSDMGHY